MKNLMENNIGFGFGLIKSLDDLKKIENFIKEIIDDNENETEEWKGSVRCVNVDENGNITDKCKNIEADNKKDFDKKFNDAVNETFANDEIAKGKEACNNACSKIDELEKQVKALTNKISYVLDQNNDLKEENIVLKKKINMFKEIFD